MYQNVAPPHGCLNLSKPMATMAENPHYCLQGFPFAAHGAKRAR
jgi:hypothetical protein